MRKTTEVIAGVGAGAAIGGAFYLYKWAGSTPFAVGAATVVAVRQAWLSIKWRARRARVERVRLNRHALDRAWAERALDVQRARVFDGSLVFPESEPEPADVISLDDHRSA